MILYPKASDSNRAFTLIELLVVLGIICVLIGLLMPCVNIAKKSLARAQTKMQFAQYVGALELYKQDHGDYPAFFNQGIVNLADHSSAFLDALSIEGYHSFSLNELNEHGCVVDAFCNPNIYVQAEANAIYLYTEGANNVRSWE